MGLAELIEEHVTETDGDAELLAMLIFEQIMNDAELLQEVVMPALRHEIRSRLRMLAAAIERDSVLSNAPTANPDADRLAFLAERFYAPPYGFVTWGEATIEQHEARIDYLNKKVNGLVDTISRHDKAIQEIRGAGVKTLGDIHGKRRRTRKKAS